MDWEQIEWPGAGGDQLQKFYLEPAPAPSSVPHGSREDPVLLNTFINALNGGAESTLPNFAVHIQLEAVDDMLSSCAVFQRDRGSWRNGLMGPK